MSTPDIIRKELEAAGLNDQPGVYDSSIHSWRCEHPDLYGPCSCFEELVEDIHKAIIASMTVETDLRIVPADHNGGKYETRRWTRHVTEWKEDPVGQPQ